jgi:predicted DNA-binding transcriptional regulator AlpA
MTNESRGYSSLFLQQVKAGDRRSLVTKYALACIKRDLPIIEIAHRLGVTRATVYNWFTSRTEPRDYHLELMQKQLTRWKCSD